MKIAIMQPYFFPYIGYFQLINAVDQFIIYDNIQYTKKGWINRNRILENGKAEYITLPLKKDSDYKNIVERSLSENWQKDKTKLLNTIKEAYIKAPFFNDVFELIQNCVNNDQSNLYEMILFSLQQTLTYLSINTEIIISSSIDINHSLKSENKIIAICHALNTTTYINPIGGAALYSSQDFENKNVKLQFLKTNDFEYHQFEKDFIPFLSIIDVMMFNSKEQISYLLNNEFQII